MRPSRRVLGASDRPRPSKAVESQRRRFDFGVERFGGVHKPSLRILRVEERLRKAVADTHTNRAGEQLAEVGLPVRAEFLPKPYSGQGLARALQLVAA